MTPYIHPSLTRKRPLPRPTSPLRKSKLRPVSAKRKAQRPARDECERVCREREGGRCAGGISSVCRGEGQHAHEALNRAQGGDPTDPRQCLWMCDPCNGWCEDFPELAHEYDLKVWRHEGQDGARAAVARVLARRK